MANQRHKKMIKLAKGYRGRANRCFTVAIQRVTKARQYAYRDRKVGKLVLKLFVIWCNYVFHPYRLRKEISVLCGFSASMHPVACMAYLTAL